MSTHFDPPIPAPRSGAGVCLVMRLGLVKAGKAAPCSALCGAKGHAASDTAPNVVEIAQPAPLRPGPER